MVLGEVAIWCQASGVMATINHLRNHKGYNWCSELLLTTNVQIYGAVVASDENLVNIGDYVVFFYQDGQASTVKFV